MAYQRPEVNTYVDSYDPTSQNGYIKHNIYLPKIIGKGYKKFWNFKGRYRCNKGSRGSKKSATTSLWYIYHMMKMPLANLLVVRRYFTTHKDSTFAQLKWACRRLQVEHLWVFKESRLEAIFKPTGQKILFRGLDDPDSVTSITVDVGVLCWVWLEEAFQISDEKAFDKIDMSIRGEVPEGYFKQFTFTFNPWSEKHWIKARFFDPYEDMLKGKIPLDSDILAITSTYRCNEWLDEADLKRFAEMSPRRFRIEGDGDWGISEGLVYDNWREEDFDFRSIIRDKSYKARFGLDFGYTTDPSGFIGLLVSEKHMKIYIFTEFYKHGMSNKLIAQTLIYMGYAKEVIIADCADPKSIDDLRDKGIRRIKASKKGKDSVNFGIQKIQDFEIIVHPSCVNTIIELSNYTWAKDTKTGQTLNKPIGDYNHIMDAMRYSLEGIGIENWGF